MNNHEILERIRNAGVIGAGGAGFPTYRKLQSPVQHIIANGAECEPLLYKDRETMVQQGEALLRGLDIMRQLTGADRVSIAIKEKNRDVIDTLRPGAERLGFEFFVYRDVYPAGDEYVLVYEITGRRIPPGGIPLQVGCVVDNVETIVNLAYAVDEQRPVTQKFITITGEVGEAITTVAPIGVSFRECINLAGGLTTDKPVILTGGVMMGEITSDLDSVVGKTTGGLIVLPEDHYLARRKSASRETYTRIGHGQCDQCSLCTELCPRYIMGYPIEPHRVMRTLMMTGEAKERGSLWAQYCCECNVCSLIACPESLDPKNICVDAKKILRDQHLSRTEQELETLFRDVHPARGGREIPIATLYQKLGLTAYDRHAEFLRKSLNPEKVIIPLHPHLGQPARPVVQIGDRVKTGLAVGTLPDDQPGCPVHASISGKISQIDAAGVHIAKE
jgi:Na+-translocating ferredoxin:NAD+ oxidoreductase RnfC subunit